MKRRTPRRLSFLLALCMVLALLPITSLAANGTHPFTDVKSGDWFSDAVEYVYQNGLMNGTSTTAFSPYAPITRGQMVTILHRLAGTPSSAGAPFTDVYDSEYYADAVAWASNNSIMSGYGGGLFGPSDLITREQLAATMYRYARYKGYDTTATGNVSSFFDGEKVSAYAVEAVNWAIGSGLFTGVGDNMFAPADGSNRAQAATILMRFCENIASSGGSTTPAGTYYTVTFDYNYDAKGTYTTATVENGKTVSAPAAPARSGYTFDGWYTAASGGSKFDFNTAVNSNLTLYAHWTSASSGGGGGSSSGGSHGGSSTPSYSDLTISENNETVGSGTYRNITITEDVGDGSVELSDLTIRGNLYIYGGGSHTIRLNNVTILGKIIMRKTADEGGEIPRLHLTKTSVSEIDVDETAIIETSTEAKVDKVEAKAETTVAGEAGTVAEVTAQAAVTVESAVVEKVVVPQNAENVVVDVRGEGTVEVEVNAENTTVATEGGSSVTVTGSEKENVKTHEHAWNEGVVTTEPTCSTEGVKTYTCTEDCPTGWTKTEPVEKLPHTPVTDAAVAADCVTPGKTEGSHCSACGEVLTAQEEAAPLGHDFSTDYTSDESGHWHKCSRCDATDEASAHTYPAGTSCDTASECTVCGYEKAAGTHTWNNGEVTTAPTCTAKGVKTYTCSTCGQTRTEEIDALGHDFSGAYTSDEIGHWHKCSRCDVTDEKAAHTYPAGVSCDEAVKCTVCGYERAAGTHTWGDWAQKDAANHERTCSACGETETAAHTYPSGTPCNETVKCTVCGYEKPAGSHSYGAWAYENETSHNHTCSVCGDTETAAHTWDNGRVTKEPTETEDGEKTYTCTTCGGTKTENVPVLSEKNIWFEDPYGYGTLIDLHWKEVELAQGEMYYFGGYPTTVNNFTLLPFMRETLTAVDESQTISVTIEAGKNNDKRILYTSEDAVKVIVSGDAPAVSVEGQADGTYKIVNADDSYNGKYLFVFKNPDGNVIWSNLSQNGVMNISPRENCTIDVRTISWIISEDTQSVTFTLSPVATVTDITLCTAPTGVREVSTYDDLLAALKAGGTVKMTQDIQPIQSFIVMTLDTGPDATLILNGHTLDILELRTYYGKHLTIDGSVAGSKICYTSGENIITATVHSSITITGEGTYQRIDASSGSDVTISGGTFSSDPSTAHGVTIDESCEVKDNGDGTWTVSAKS